MLIIHTVLICPNPQCNQERERFNDDEDGTLVTCPQCGIVYEIGRVKEIEVEW